VSLKVHNNCFYTIDWTGSNNIEANSSHFLLQFAQNNSEISVSSDCGEKFCKALCETLGDDGGGYWLVRMEWCPAGWSVCLPLLIFPCTMKSRSSLLAPAHPGGPGKRAIKRLWCGVVWWYNGYKMVVVVAKTVVDDTDSSMSNKCSVQLDVTGRVQKRQEGHPM